MKKQFENMHWVKKLLFAFVFVVLFMTSPHAYAADGDLVWRVNAPTSNGGASYGGVAVDATGVYAAGFYVTSFVSGDWFVEKRSLNNGLLIWGKRIDVGGSPSGVTVDDSGVYIAGASSYLSYWYIEKRSLINGSVIWTKTSDPGGSYYEYASGVTVNSSGLYVVGIDTSLGLSSILYDSFANTYINIVNTQWRIEKRSLNTGDILWFKTENLSVGGDDAHGVAVDASGVYIVGEQLVNWDTQWRIEKRSLDTGDLLWAKTINTSIYSERPRGVAVDASGVYTAGISNASWRIEKRALNTGDIMWQKEIAPTTSYWGEVNDIAVNGSGVYVVGSDVYNNNGYHKWRAEKHSLDTGDLVWQKIIPDGISSRALGVVTDASAVYATGWSTAPGSDWWPLEKRESTPPAPCNLPWGGTTPSGSSVTAYQSAIVTAPATCTPQTRTCTNGTLSGTYTNQSCVVSAALAVPTVTTPTATAITTTGATLGANVTSLGNPATISARGTCWGTTTNPTTNCTPASGLTTGIFTHARTGMLPGTIYYYRGYATNTTGTGYSPSASFTPTASSCNLPWGGTTPSGSSVTAYQSAIVTAPATCTPQTRTCTNGTLSGTYTNQSCVVSAKAVSLAPLTSTIALGQSVTFSSTASFSDGSMIYHNLNWRKQGSPWNWETGYTSVASATQSNYTFAATTAHNLSTTLTPTQTGTYDVYAAASADGITWTSSVIATITVTCNNGATNPPACTTCAVGYSMYAGTCYANCVNGTLNPPLCNLCPGGQTFVAGSCVANCVNGATNPPTCTTCPVGQTIVAGVCTVTTVCGDGICNVPETLLSCPKDCKAQYKQF